MSLLPFLLFSLWAAPGHRVVGVVLFDGDIQHLAAAANMVYVSTEESLYQLTSRLTLVHSLRQRGVLQPEKDRPDLLHFRRVSESTGSNATLRINVLLPFVENDTLISCGVTSNRCGHCDVLRLGDISTLLHNETFQLGPLRHSGGSVASIVALGIGSARARYILTAVAQLPGASETYCASDTQIINLHNAYNSQYGGIFSLTDDGVTPSIKAKGAVEFVDAFQISGTIYVLANVRPDAGSGRVRLLWMQAGSNKDATFRSLRGVELTTAPSGVGGGRLLASSVVPGVVPVLWCGLFTVDAAQTNTALLLFGISPDPSVEVDADPDICSACGSNGQQLKTLQPETVLFRWDNMTAVLAMKQKAWVVFFIGTGDGQLIKLSMDKGHRTSCPIMLYRANDDRQVFPKIHLDQVDRKHVYVPLGNELVLVPVSKCTTYTKVEECWSAQDPQCVWCGSTRRCTFEDDCDDSDWVSIPDDYQEKMVSYSVSKDSSGQITLRVQAHVTAGQSAMSNFTCQFSTISGVPCGKTDRLPHFPQCICHLGNNMLHAEGLEVSVRISIGTTQLVKQLTLTNCSDIRGLPTSSVLCQQCIRAGCGWNQNKCSWANEGVTNDSVCQMRVTGMNFSRPEISSITPPEVSFYGWNHAVLTGHNLSDVTGVRIQAHTDCSPRESPVWNNTGVNLTFHIPGTDSKGVVRVCALLPDGSCHGSAQIAYQSSPSCTGIVRNSTWFSGKRKVTITGSHLNFVEGIIHSHTPQEVQLPTSINYQNLSYDTLPTENTKASFNSTLFLKVANKTLSCHTYITYYPEPQFTTFRPIKTGKVVHITVEKKADKLGIGTEELLVWGIQRGKEYRCLVRTKETHNETDFFTCDIQDTLDAEFQKLIIKYGAKTVTLDSKPSVLFIWVLVVLVLIICITVIVLFVYLNKQKKFTAEMNRLMENLELDIRNDIRQGFVDLQTEKADLLENVGAIPFLDYKHFASRIFFPESESLMTLCVKDIGQDAEKVQLDECCHGLSRLIQDQLFLTSMVHALEEQKSFTIKDKCAMASLLTVALHSNLSYLTEIMEALLKDLVQQNSNTQPKLLLRRTESTVEKLLTNWMSICLYGFLRESVGQHLFLMVSALTQQITKGPVDRVTEKALYTLNEDWLLWQAQDFTSLKLKVLFAVGSDGQVSEPLEVNSLSCDTVEQVKEKILSSFKAKFGFPYYIPLKDVCIEFEKDGSYVPLEEVDKSSDVIGELRMLNTLQHYKVPDGATIKVVSKKSHPPLSPQGSLKDEENFSGKYFHMIDPDVDEDQRKNPERKKLKLKEVHLTKLLSTKVAVHSFVENLFRSIWGTPLGKAPPAVKYFFDFLDSQAEDVKIVDPDVLHIWKTNSLPLRFWVNILKNPQFVFDMEKTPQLDGCLSVIAQAFMDSFSLTENPLGKHTPTNKLLYAKDIPKFKQEVKAYYRHIKDQSPITDSEFEAFLQEESKKHENEFNETAALRELYKFIQKYLTEIREKLNQNGAPSELVEQLYHVKNLFDGLKSCSWS